MIIIYKISDKLCRQKYEHNLFQNLYLKFKFELKLFDLRSEIIEYTSLNNFYMAGNILYLYLLIFIILIN